MSMVGQRLRLLRLEQSLTLDQVAFFISVNVRSNGYPINLTGKRIEQFEGGFNTPFEEEIVRAYAHLFSENPKWIMGYSEDRVDNRWLKSNDDQSV